MIYNNNVHIFRCCWLVWLWSFRLCHWSQLSKFMEISLCSWGTNVGDQINSAHTSCGTKVRLLNQHIIKLLWWFQHLWYCIQYRSIYACMHSCIFLDYLSVCLSKEYWAFTLTSHEIKSTLSKNKLFSVFIGLQRGIAHMTQLT